MSSQRFFTASESEESDSLKLTEDGPIDTDSLGQPSLQLELTQENELTDSLGQPSLQLELTQEKEVTDSLGQPSLQLELTQEKESLGLPSFHLSLPKSSSDLDFGSPPKKPHTGRHRKRRRVVHSTSSKNG